MDVEFLRYQFQNGFSGVITKYGFSIGVRHLQMAYMFISSVVMGAIRGSIGLAVVAMTYEKRFGDTYIQIHNWDRRIQGAILSSFFFGYALLSLPADLYLKNLSGKYVVTAMLFINGAVSVAMPTIANKGGWIAVCNAMLLMGMAHAGFSTVNQRLLDKWLPPNEKKTFSCLIFGGIHLGIIIALPVSGLLSLMSLGWELVFYSMAMMSLAMAIIYGVLTSSSPEQHQAIGNKEKEFIRDSLMSYSKRSIAKPWQRILSSPQFWAAVCTHAASNAVFVFFLVDIPAFWKILVPLDYAGKYTMIPFIGMWLTHAVTAPTLGWISNLKLVSYIVSVTNYRKIINCLGASGVIIGLTFSSVYAGGKTITTLVFHTITLSSLGLQFSGFLSSYSDMSENYAGTLMMLGSAISSFIGAAVPFISGMIIKHSAPDSFAWKPVFLYLACMYTICNVAYSVLGSNTRQHWDLRPSKHLGHYNGIMGASGVIIGLTFSSVYAGGKTITTLVFHTITLSSLGLQFSGFLSSYSDMSENYAGTLMMLGSAISSFIGAAVPFISGMIIKHSAPDSFAWKPVFLYLACMYTICNVAYSVLGSNTRQHWDLRPSKHLGHYNGIMDANQVQLEEFRGYDTIQNKHENVSTC